MKKTRKKKNNRNRSKKRVYWGKARNLLSIGQTDISSVYCERVHFALSVEIKILALGRAHSQPHIHTHAHMEHGTHTQNTHINDTKHRVHLNREIELLTRYVWVCAACSLAHSLFQSLARSLVLSLSCSPSLSSHAHCTLVIVSVFVLEFYVIYTYNLVVLILLICLLAENYEFIYTHNNTERKNRIK